jgi:hypothetical protein
LINIFRNARDRWPTVVAAAAEVVVIVILRKGDAKHDGQAN